MARHSATVTIQRRVTRHLASIESIEQAIYELDIAVEVAVVHGTLAILAAIAEDGEEVSLTELEAEEALALVLAGVDESGR